MANTMFLLLKSPEFPIKAYAFIICMLILNIKTKDKALFRPKLKELIQV